MFRPAGSQSGQPECWKTPLAQAIIDGELDAVEDLLLAGADINEYSYFQGGRGEPPLCVAVRYRREDMVTALIAHGASVHITNSSGNTPLVLAAQKNYASIVYHLLSYSADANTSDELGHSALFWIVKHRNLEAVKVLLQHGADIQKSNPKLAVLPTAVTMGVNEITKVLLAQSASVDIRDASQETPLFNAIRVNNMEIVCTLLDLGADVNVINQDMRMPLHFCGANVHNNVVLTEMLLERGAHINALDRYQNSALVLCLNNYILKPNSCVAKCMIRHGSDVNHSNCIEAMQWTARDNNFEAVQFAIKAGFRITGVQWIQEFLDESHDIVHRWIYQDHDGIAREKAFIELVRGWLKNAQPLTVLCRIAVRELLMCAGPCSIHRRIERLPLPDLVKGFLKMEDEL